MKKLLPILGLIGALGLTACQTVDKEQTCQTATAAYAVYLAIVASGGEPSESETRAAAVAGEFLKLYCGWESGGAASRGTVLRVVDSRGVPVIRPTR